MLRNNAISRKSVENEVIFDAYFKYEKKAAQIHGQMRRKTPISQKRGARDSTVRPPNKKPGSRRVKGEIYE